jgi:hypothetical protein
LDTVAITSQISGSKTIIMTKHEEIKTIKLYLHPDRIERGLKELGYTSKGVQVDPEKLATLNSLHFFGDEPICRIVEQLSSGGVPLATIN